MTADFRHRYGPWALVAGASEGLGAEFARQIAARGVNVFLLALDTPALEEVAREIRLAHGVEVRTAALDFAVADLDRELDRIVGGLEVGLLVYNAAHAPVGQFLQQELEDKLRALDVNTRAPLVFVHRFGRRMVGRGRGGIVLLASMAGFQGTAMVVTYAATKAFDLVLAEGLWSELREHGIDVLACCPGETRTPGYLRSNPKGGRRPMEPRVVVAEALAALGRGPTRIAGRGNRWAAFIVGRLLPRRLAVLLVSRATSRMFHGR